MDIDSDIQDDRREEVINYVREKYGYDHVSRIITFITNAARASVRMIARILDKPVSLGDKIAKTIPNKPKMTLDKAFEQSPAFTQLYNEDAECKEIIDLAKSLEGLKTAVSIHACGVLITPSPVVDFMPQVMIKDKDTKEYVATTQLTMTECEDAGCLKMDFLGLRNLGVISDCCFRFMYHFMVKQFSHLVLCISIASAGNRFQQLGSFIISFAPLQLIQLLSQTFAHHFAFLFHILPVLVIHRKNKTSSFHPFRIQR